MAALVLAFVAATSTPLADARVRAVGDEGAARGRYRIAAAGDSAGASDPGADPSECRYDDTADLVVDAGFTCILFRDLYHFTVGGAVEDGRLATRPAYAEDVTRRS